MASRLSLPVTVAHATKSSLIPTSQGQPTVASWANGDGIRRQFGIRSVEWRMAPTALPVTPRAGKVSMPFRFLKEGEKGADRISVLTKTRSDYNDIVMVDTPENRVLLLDSSHAVSSIITKDGELTGSYWDECATLPAVVPQGPIAILGLGAGTAARIMLNMWPSLHLEGWEIDEILVEKSREHFGLSELEKRTDSGGFLSVHIGDALSPSAGTESKFAGIIVDLFVGGEVLPQLNKVDTWLKIQERLMPGGRILVNCGGFNFKLEDGSTNRMVLADSSWVPNSVIKALREAFPGQLWWKRLEEKEGHNYLALTGPAPDLRWWSAAVPAQLSSHVKQWKPCEVAKNEPCLV